MLTKIKSLSKKIYYYSEFASNKKNLHKTWKIIHSVLPHKSTLEPPLALKVNDHIVDDPNTIANQFNNYFCTIGSNLADTINSETTKKPTDFLKKKILDSIFLDPLSTNETLNQIISLKNKAVGHDNIQPFFIKAARHVIAPYLSRLLNFVFTEGIFPRNCKTARITPIYKSGAKEEMNNYRPISILTCFAKIIEKILLVRLSSFFKKHNVIYENQYDFQSNISTSHAMLDVVTSSYDNIDDHFYTELAFVDLKKAFNTVSHNILLTKLNNYGIRGVAYTLIRSYLDNRQQLVSINQSQSNLKPIRVGVPQGSSLGPMFFLIYINDLHNSLESEPRLLYVLISKRFKLRTT